MSTNELHIKFKSSDDFFSEVESSLRNKEKSIDKVNELFFDSIKSFHRFFTHTKIDLLMAIKHLKPSSIYELSKMLDRPFTAVLKDVNALDSNGFIRLEESQSHGRKTKVPNLSFNYSVIIIHKTQLPYSIQLQEAA